ncbi:phosphatase 2C-like domain-containing protein [Blyttiomyces helicus]|uniref:Protein phosphatase n=1 Tax=Blyttiomyces helicus TaxID=388810 RepID=A0A4P9WER6_9FUNG|nr:phosphatase 2C-like domain-containing protein [Blyttiomyces helicus]|eukprot:RKO88896.1 phosphatase 2C-like domain-containing protein [Blyttiomyces helicus]
MRYDSLGVADGVGGWGQVKGANPALYSRKLMHYASAELNNYDDIANTDIEIGDYYGVDPKAILAKSYALTTRDAADEGIVGSSTALVVILRDDELRIANIGDCGIMIIRNHEPIFRNEEQQHSFNFPFQLGTGSRDSPVDAQLFKVKVQEGDIVILGSDGMFDNVFDDEIVDIVRGVVNGGGVDPKRITDALLGRAREVAEDGRFASSPFQSRAIQEGLYYQGGKMDDVTVLAGVVR